MSDPRYTDRTGRVYRDRSDGTTWSILAAIAAIVIIGFIIYGSADTNTKVARNAPTMTTTAPAPQAAPVPPGAPIQPRP